MPTLSNRLRQAAQYTGLDSMRELLIEAAGALESVEPAAFASEYALQELFEYGSVAAYLTRDSRPDSSCTVPLYTTPQPQERKPLTDEQIKEICRNQHPLMGISFARAIEAAHGISEEKE